MTDLRTDPPNASPARPTPAPRRRVPRRNLVILALALLAVLAGMVLPRLHTTPPNTTAKDRIAADPPPSLFAPTQTRRVETLTQPQQLQAAHLLATWWRDHGAVRDDAAFTSWLEQHFPSPPAPARRSAEMREVERLDRARTSGGVTAASWLEQHGKKDVWKLEVHDQAEYLAGSAGDARKNQVDDLLSMSKHVSDSLAAKFRQSAPYVLQPSLRPDHHVPSGAVCPCSYPSNHAARAAGARTFLAHFDPQRDTEYRWFQDQIDFSRLYMAGHVASDIAGGSLLGDLIGDYFLVTRAGVAPRDLA